MFRHLVRPTSRRRVGLGTALAAGLALATPASALDIAHGDIIAVYQKNGFEVVVNLGPLMGGDSFDLTGVVDIPEFGGTLEGARFAAVGVANPAREVDFGFGPLPQPDVIYSTQAVNPSPTDEEIELASFQLDQPLPGSTAWFELLRALGPGDSEVIMIDETFSYEETIGLGTDRIGNNLPFSIAGVFDASENLDVAIQQSIRGYESFGGPPTNNFTLLYFQLSGTSGMVDAPEPGIALLFVVGAGVLVPFARRRRARA